MDTSNILVAKTNKSDKSNEIETKDLYSEEVIKWVKDYRWQVENIIDKRNNKFKTQLSEERVLEIADYAWNPAKTFKQFHLSIELMRMVI